MSNIRKAGPVVESVGLAVIDPETPENEVDSESDERQEDRLRQRAFFEKAFHILNAYQLHQLSHSELQTSTARKLRMSYRAMALALGFNIPAGADNQADLARQLGVSKQRVKKCIEHFITQLNLPALPGQRDEEARSNMSAARRRQIEKSPEKKAINRVLKMKDPHNP